MENNIERIVRTAFVDVNEGEEAIAVVNATARAVGLAVATAFTEAEASVSVTGEGVAQSTAESQASALAKATARAILEAVSEATDGDRVAESNVSIERAPRCIFDSYSVTRILEEHIGQNGLAKVLYHKLCEKVFITYLVSLGERSKYAPWSCILQIMISLEMGLPILKTAKNRLEFTF